VVVIGITGVCVCVCVCGCVLGRVKVNTSMLTGLLFLNLNLISHYFQYIISIIYNFILGSIIPFISESKARSHNEI